MNDVHYSNTNNPIDFPKLKKSEYMKDLNWIMMLDILSGAKFTNYGLNQMAQLNTGKVIETKQYMLMTERTYVPTNSEKFANL